MLSDTLLWFSAACFLLLVGYLLGVQARRRVRLDAVSLKTLMEQYETAVIAYYSNPGSLELTALKEARAHFVWWGLHD